MVKKRRSKGKSNGLVAIALIFGLLGAGFGGFLMLKEYVFAPKPLPKARIYCNIGSYSIPAYSTQKFDFTSTTYDTHNAFDQLTDTYTVPETGFYQIYVQISIEAYDDDKFTISVYYDGLAYSRTTHIAAGFTNFFAVTLSTTVNASAGSELNINFYQYNVGLASRLVYEGESRTYWEITQIP